MKNAALIVLLIFLNSFAVLSQQIGRDEALAAQYFAEKEFDKAADIYERLFNKTGDPDFFSSYLNCLIELREFKAAEKITRKQIKKNPDIPQLSVELGRVFRAANEKEKAEKEFQNAIGKLIPDQQQVLNLAQLFLDIKEPQFAVKTYLQGRKLLRDIYPFNFELAAVYDLLQDYPAMINEYLDVLEINESYLQSVQNALQTSIGEDKAGKKNELLKNQLIKRVQSQPDKMLYYDMLIWLYVQEKDFESAFVQTKAIDKRARLDGGKLIALANIAASNQSYDVAIKCYQYVISKGSSSPYYATSKTELLNVLNKKITSSVYTLNDLTVLEANYAATITELGKSVNTAPVLKGYAHLLAFYLNKTDEAISILQEAISLSLGNPRIQAECKLELADILLMTGELWESSLLYSQVEKSFKEDPLGQEAKFRNARLSYYKGDFAWAQAQLKVLKASTSKLIANDALFLSLLITDNTGLDSITEPLLIYSRAELLSFQNKDSLALATLDSINVKYPAHSLADEILYRKALIMIKKQKFEQAASFLEAIVNTYAFDILGDDALFKLAELNELYFKNTEKAKELYQDLLVKYPGSLYTVEARKRFRTLRGDLIN